MGSSHVRPLLVLVLIAISSCVTIFSSAKADDGITASPPSPTYNAGPVPDQIQQHVQQLYNERTPLPSQQPLAISSVPSQSQAATSNYDYIRSNTARLYSETLPRAQAVAVQQAPLMAPQLPVAPVATTYPPVLSHPPDASAPTAIFSEPAPQPANSAMNAKPSYITLQSPSILPPASVAVPTTQPVIMGSGRMVQSPASVDTYLPHAARPIGNSAQADAFVQGPVFTATAATSGSAVSVASAIQPAPSATPGIAQSGTVGVMSMTPPAAIPTNSNPKTNASTTGVPLTPKASIAPLEFDVKSAQERSVYSGQQATAFINELAGTTGVPLNVVDAPTPADIQTPLHLEEAVAFALKNNFEVQAATQKTNGAFWDKMGAYSEYMPSITVSADTGPERSTPAAINDQFGNRVLANDHNRKDDSIVITQPLIDLSIISDILSGTDKKKLADTDEHDVREGIAFDTASTFLDLLQSRISIRLADQYKGYLDDLAKRMQARFTGGGATSADLDRIRGRSTAAESARLEALGTYEANVSDLKRLIKVTPAELAIPTLLAPVVPQSEETALSLALTNNPSYISSLQKADLASDDRNKSFSTLLPKLVGQYSNYYSFNAGGVAEGNPVDGVFPYQRTQSVLLVAQWALNGGTAVTSGISGVYKKKEMDLRALDVRARIEQAIQTSYAAINAAHLREIVLQKSVEDNHRVVTSFEIQYQSGGRSLFDMLDAYEQLYIARLNLMRVIFAEAKASYQVRRQMGELQQSILSSEDH